MATQLRPWKERREGRARKGVAKAKSIRSRGP